MNELVLQIPAVGMEAEPFAVLLITALAGGAFGAALGALPSFIFTGFVVLLGEGIAILEGNLAGIGAVPPGEVATGLTGVIGFGAVTGLLGEVTQRIFYAHSGTHVDPPAVAIAIGTVLIGILFRGRDPEFGVSRSLTRHRLRRVGSRSSEAEVGCRNYPPPQRAQQFG